MITFESKYKQRDSHWVTIAAQLWEVKKDLKKQIEQEENLLVLLREASFNEPSCGGDFKFDAILRKGNIDYTSIPALKFMDFEPFRKPGYVAWKLNKT